MRPGVYGHKKIKENFVSVATDEESSVPLSTFINASSYLICFSYAEMLLRQAIQLRYKESTKPFLNKSSPVK